MNEAILQATPMAIALAFSPLPILALILILMTHRPGLNSLFFLIGWFTGIMAVCSIVFVMPKFLALDENPESGNGYLLIFGILLLCLVVIQTIRYKYYGKEMLPGVFDRLDRLNLGQSWFTGLFFSGLNMKNIPIISAGALVLIENAKGNLLVGATLVFGLISSLTLILPIIVNRVFRDEVAPVMTKVKDWLGKYNTPIIITILYGLSVWMIWKETIN